MVPLSTISRNLDEDLNQNSIDHDQNDKDRIVPSQDTYDIPGGKGTIDKDVEKGKKTYTENTPVKNNLAVSILPILFVYYSSMKGFYHMITFFGFCQTI